MTEKPVVAYADGSCLGNPGPGGWGVLIIYPDGKQIELSGSVLRTTNNRMELMAAIKALKQIEVGSEVVVRSDSQWLINTMNRGWKRNFHHDLWLELDAETRARKVTYEWVRGHAGDPFNQRADALAQAAAKKAQRAALT